jgi:MEMO1 family protein
MPPTTTHVRPAAVAGRFYAGEPAALRAELDAMLAAAPSAAGPRPKALIVPHAGYIYSGPIAASAYNLLRGMSPLPRRIVLLGPAHTVALRGVALPEADVLATPLGEVRVDPELAALALACPQVLRSDVAHAREHALEVQLPFLQRVLPEFTLLPLVVGHVDAAVVAAVLDAVWGDDDTLIVISSDLSHYLPYADARRIDGATAEQLLALDSAIEPEQACGAFALRGFLRAARARRLAPRLLDLRSSGDTAGDRRRVVGYAALAYAAPGAA